MVAGMHLTALGDGAVLLEPSEGLDPTDPDAYVVPLLEYLQQSGATRLIYDLADAVVVDAVYYGWLKSLYNACRVTGVTFISANIRPEAAYALATTLEETPPFPCARDVEAARRL